VLFPKTKNVSVSMPKDAKLSVVAPDVNLLGTLISEGMVDFGGTIDGNIRCHTLTVRSGAAVRGDVEADILHVYGKINGLIRAKHVHLYADCHVEGIVMHEALTMEDGAFLDGKCKRLDKANHTEDKAVQDEPAANVRMFENIRLIN
jgi:cytoskeletal protein CcmA (bactofilin family)